MKKEVQFLNAYSDLEGNTACVSLWYAPQNGAYTMLMLLLLFSCVESKEQSFEYTFQADSPKGEVSVNSDREDSAGDGESLAEELDSAVLNDTPSEDSALSTPPSDAGDSGICSAEDVGTKAGDCAENFSLRDIDDALVSLHDFHGHVIFLDLSSYN